MSTLTTIQSTDLITASRANINDNFSALNSEKLETSVLDTDSTFADASDSKIPSQLAVKQYVDAGGNVNASTTARGIVELATAAEIDAGTATGATGAALVVTAEALKSSLAPIVRTYLNAGSPHTWTKPAGLKYVVVEVQAAGGGGGGASDTVGLRGSGGGGGGYSKKIIGTTTLGSTETVTVGAGGAGSTTGTATTGETSSFGAHATATGGTGGTGSNGIAGDGGVGSLGDLNLYGQRGTQSTDTGSIRGDGGHSFLGGSVVGKITNSTDNGNTGRLYGGGGGGGARNSTGGTGAAGVVIVTEYYV